MQDTLNKRLFVILAMALCTSASKGQSPFYYEERISDYRPDKARFEKTTSVFDSISATIHYHEINENIAMRKALKENKELLQKLEASELLMQEDSLSQFLQKTVEKIRHVNSDIIKKPIQVYTYRISEPNAANYGGGILLVNLGLIAKLKSESQITFILCHEIAHDLRGHVMEGIRKQYELEHQNDLREQYQKLKSKKYNKYKSYENYVAEYLSRYTAKSRQLESQADSLGLVLYCRAGYPLEEAYSTLLELDSINSKMPEYALDYPSFFTSSEYPFRPIWLEPEVEEETIGGSNLSGIHFPDSLKTHPNCKDRAKTLKTIPVNCQSNTLLNVPYITLNLLARFEMLDVYLQEKSLSKGLYETLQLQRLYPNNIYLKCAYLEFLYELQKSKDDHYLSLVCDKTYIEYNASYKHLLNLIFNTNSDALKSIAFEYYHHHVEEIEPNPYSEYVTILLMSIKSDSKQLTSWINNYQKKYGNNYYFRILESKFKLPY